MGSLIVAKCPCGLESQKMLMGSGWSGGDYAPAICVHCGSIEQKRYHAKGGKGIIWQTCASCARPMHFINERGYCTSTELLHGFPELTSLDADAKKVRYLCPKCREFGLALEFVGLWD